MNLRDWMLAGTLGGLAGALRVPFALLPGVQPSTALVIASGAALGPRVGAAVGILVPLVSNMILGHGLHTLPQMIGWGAIGLASGLLPRLGRRSAALWGAAAAMAFGIWTDVWLWLVFARPHDLAGLLFLALRGLPFNALHAVATAGVLWWLGPRLDRLLCRARVRIQGLAPRPAVLIRTPGPVKAPDHMR